MITVMIYVVSVILLSGLIVYLYNKLSIRYLFEQDWVIFLSIILSVTLITQLLREILVWIMKSLSYA